MDIYYLFPLMIFCLNQGVADLPEEKKKETSIEIQVNIQLGSV